MQTVKSIEEAENFFTANEGAEVICQNENNLTKVVSNVEDARAFFDEVEVEADAESADAVDAGETVGGQVEGDQEIA